MPSESQVDDQTSQNDEKSRWVATGVQQIFLQRHLSLLQSRNGNRLTNRLLVALAIGLAWFVPVTGIREQWASGLAVHLLALVVILNWRIGDRRVSVELTLLERSLSGEGTSYGAAKAEHWEDQYVAFRANMARTYKDTLPSYKGFGEVQLWTYLTALSLLGKVLALTGRFPFAR